MKTFSAPTRNSATASRPLFLAFPPWLAIASALSLASIILWLGLSSARQEADITARLMREKGDSLIGTLEGALRTGMGFHWTDEELQDLLEKTGAQPDILYVLITDAHGQVLAGSKEEMLGSAYLTPDALQAWAPGSQVQWHMLETADTPPHAVVYRTLGVPRFNERLEHYGQGRGQGRGGGMGQGSRRQQVREAERKYTGQPLHVFVAYNALALHKAKEADTLHLLVVLTMVGCLLMVGGVVFVLVRDYQKSRRQMQEQLHHSERLAALGTMAAGIAHEVRNPLGAIKGLARYFQDGNPKDSEEYRVAVIMTHEVARLDKVVSDMLNLARPDHLHCEPVALDILAQRVVRLLEQDATAQGVAVTMDFPLPAPCLMIDADRMTQVLLNLCCNSLQALPQGGSILLRYAQTRSSLHLEVQDNGPGMPEDVRAQALSPYFTTRSEGTGLGLSIVHKIVQAHGGSVEINSAPKQGTCVRLILPRACLVARPHTTGQEDRADRADRVSKTGRSNRASNSDKTGTATKETS